MKKPYSVGYFSSYDRGLECLLGMWPKIKERVQEATLEIYYGWETFDRIHANNPQMMAWKQRMIELMQQPGVTEHGRVSHTELAKAMKEIQVWAYPTEFTEIHCITALKAQEAECFPVTTKVAALRETVVSGSRVDAADIYTNKEAQEEFIRYVVMALRNPHEKTLLQAKPENRYWPDVAWVWSDVMGDEDASEGVKQSLTHAHHEGEFEIENYDEFYNNHYFEPMNDRDARNAGERLERVKWAVDVAKEIKPKRILDLGCLEGYTLFTIADKVEGVSGVGVDLSKQGISLARKRNKKYGMHFDFALCSIEDFLEKTNAKFDMITCFEIMEHVKDPELVLKLMDKVLAPGGQVLISTPSFESPFFGMDDEKNKCHIRLYTTKDEDYTAVNKYGHERLATSLSKQVGKDRIIEMEVVAESINCRYQ